MLLGRRTECAAIRRLLERAQAGKSGVLVLRGEPGIGKSALLAYAARAATGFTITRAAGVDSEIAVAFGALHQVCQPFLDRVDQLPEPQRDVLQIAFGLRSGEVPTRLLVGLATLSLLSDAARSRPVLCVVDDAQWLDRSSAQALAFVARRLGADSVAMLLGRRLGTGHDETDGLPDLTLQGLAQPDAHELFEKAFPLSVDRDVEERILDEARGNPLAILELPRSVAPAAMAGGFGALVPLAGRLEESFQQRVDRLPTDTQLILLVAAAEPLGDPVVLWRAAEELGLPLEAIAPAEADGLVTVGAHVAFRHPLVRSAVYASASPANRRRAHQALAGATDASLDPDRAAWHRSQAVLGPDEAIAEELERCAARAQARGGLFASAAFLGRAVELSVDPIRRAERALAAAKSNEFAGAEDSALRLLRVAESGPLDERLRAEADHVRAEVAFNTNRGSDAARLLLRAARRMERFDVVRARVTYLEALCAALFAAGFTKGSDAIEVAKAARTAGPIISDGEDGVDLLLTGSSTLLIEGEAAAAPVLRRALNAFAEGDVSLEAQMRWGWLACRLAPLLWDDAIWPVVAGRAARVARLGGSLPAMAAVAPSAMAMHVLAGEMVAAEALAEDASLMTESSGIPPLPYGLVVVAAWRGREPQAAELIDASVRGLTQRGEGMGLALVHWARALLHNSRGRYAEALTEAEAAATYPPGMLYSCWGLIELIEAASRCGNARRGAHALHRLAESTQASGTDWALGIEARSRSLLSSDNAAEDYYREAIARLGRTRIRAETARAHLLFGEWLRRHRRRTDAREHLRTAVEMFESMDAAAFANRARVELLATGEHARKRTELPGADLSPQESRIAVMASRGMSDLEIASQLFISASTVDYHLRKVFRKLGVNSRARLHLVLPPQSAATSSS